MSTAEEKAEPFVMSAITEIVAGNNRAEGDYILVANMTVDSEGLLYTWQWFWSPKAPVQKGQQSGQANGT